VWREEAGGPGDLPTITIWRYFVQMLNLQLRRPSTRGRHSSRVFPQLKGDRPVLAEERRDRLLGIAQSKNISSKFAACGSDTTRAAQD
jgi:hypothetical protein